ncbi:hypothetical protein Q9L58_007406 [Maublancomyces gigas]|uniref:Uncharacterized protein n=1 Tax=Discina gigas TaxID=1032678 RepID=A0ABR3GCZ0_9PEZI
MAKCQGSADPTYDTYIEQYGTIFAGKPKPEAALCTGCAAKALGIGFVAYGGKPDNVDAAKKTYEVEMEKCRAAGSP